MRLFTAVGFGAQDRETVSGVVKKLRTRAPLDQGHVKWVEPQNLHLTLHFLGAVGADVGEKLVRAFEPVLHRPAFSLSLGAVGIFPPRGRPRAVWIGVGTGAAEMAALRRGLQARLTPLGFVPDDHPYHPHVTIGRMRRGRSVSRPALVDALAAVMVPPLGMIVDRVLLIESRLKTAGPSYHVLAEMSLRGTDSEDAVHSA